jgi:hypothetical protein
MYDLRCTMYDEKAKCRNADDHDDYDYDQDLS